MKKTTLFVLLLLSAILVGNIKAEIKLAGIFGDNMILQQQSDASLWGWSKPNATVNVKTSWNNKSYAAKSDKDGRWVLKVKTPQAGGPFSIKISDGHELTLNNVMIGEVWICSGQSNMDMPMIGYNGQPVNNSLDATIKSKNKNIRLFTVKREYDVVPLNDCTGMWQEASPESVNRFSATAYFFGRLINEVTDVPVGLIVTSWGGSSIKSWMSAESLSDFNMKAEATKESVSRPNQSPATLFNAMLNPLVGYGMRGVIWYQGETDKHIPNQYVRMFDSMVKDWRMKWNVGEFPVYFCQIAPYDSKKISNGALFREAQEKCANLTPNTGMAVLMDSNSPDCIHPANKQQAGERLAYWALAETYGIKDFTYKSPSIKSVKFENGIASIIFNDALRGLTSYDKEVEGVLIAGADKKWYKGTVSFNDNKMYVFSSKVKEPVAVRYAFTDYAKGEIFSNQGLPVSSFRTDNWED